MAKWKYGDAQAHWNVRHGDMWAMGPHLLACGDIEAGDARWLAEKHQPTLLYSDPPWGRNLANAFRSQAGVKAAADYLKVLKGVIEIGALAGIGCIEMSLRDASLLERLLRDAEASIVQRWDIHYSNRRRCVLLAAIWDLAGRRDVSALQNAPDPTGMSDAWHGTPSWAISNLTKPNDCVFDPCTGLGSTLKAAHALGRRFVGTELNPQKAAEVLAWADAEGLSVTKAVVYATWQSPGALP